MISRADSVGAAGEIASVSVGEPVATRKAAYHRRNCRGMHGGSTGTNHFNYDGF